MSKLSAMLLIVILAFGLVAPETSASSKGQLPALHTEEPVCGTPVTIPLVTSSNQTRGTLTVANGETKLFVTYTANAPWKLREMQLAAASSLSGIPVNQHGNPKVGNFPYKKEVSGVTSYTFKIPLTNLGSSVYIAAHAELRKSSSNHYRGRHGNWYWNWYEEQAEVWAQGTRFVQTRGNWAMYFTYAVQPCNQPPVAVNDTATVAEDSGATTLDVLANDTDADGDPFTIASASDPAHGTVVIAGDGLSLTYQPDANYCNDGSPTDSFTYTLNPGGATTTVAVTVTCVDDLPVAVNDPVNVVESSVATTINVLANDTDTEGNAFSIASVTQPANGTVVVAGDNLSLTYQPNLGYCNNGSPTDDFTYSLNPGGSTATVSVTILCVDDTPAAVNDTATVDEDSSATTIDVLANDFDLDGDPFTIASASDPAHGTVVVAGDGLSLTYQPDANYCNDGSPTDTFTYTLTPGGSTATVAVTVTCLDDQPVAVNDAVSVAEDSSPTVVTVLTNDSDVDGDPFTIASASDPANGTVVVAGDGLSLTYQPDAGYCNDGTPTDDFTYSLNPGGSTATVAVTVVCVDDEPVAINDLAAVDEDSSATTIAVLTNDANPDGGPISIDSVTQPANGVVAITNSGADLTYTPNADYCNGGSPTDDFTYTLTPGGSSATVAVTVTCVDDASTAVDDTATMDEDAGAKTLNLLINDTDIDGGVNSISAVTQPANGTVIITNGGADITYQPNADYCNDGSPTDDFTYTVSPGGSIGNVAVTVTCINDAPSFNLPVNPDQNAVEDSGAQTVSGFATNISAGPANESGQTVTFNVSNDNNSLFSSQPDIDETSGDLTYTPANGATGSAVVSVYLTDNGGIANGGVDTSATHTFTITVAPLTAPPVAAADNYFTTVNTTISRAASDPDDLLDNDDLGVPAATLSSFGGGSLGGTVTDNAAGANIALAGGTLTVNTDGSFSLTTPTVTGSFTFQYRLTNGSGSSDALVTIEVQGPPEAFNDEPNGNSVPGDAFHTALDTTLDSSTDDSTPSVLDNDVPGFPTGTVTHFGGGSLGGGVTDNSADSSVNFGTGGSLQVNADGEFIFTPSSGFTGLFTFEYRVANVSGSDDATVTIAVGVRPAAVADARAATGNVRLSTPPNLLTNDSGDLITVTLSDIASAQGGVVSVNANGDFTYNPPAGYEGSDSFTYTINNGFATPSVGTVNITVSGMIWFINNTAAAGDGRLTSPFNSLGAFQAVNNGAGNNPAAGDNIFVYTGSGSYTGGVTLLNNQKLIGDGSSSNLAAIAGISLAPGSDPLPTFSGTDPTLENAAGNGITLASGNTVRGLTVGNTPAGFGYSGDAVGTFNIQEASKTGTGGALNISTSGTVGTVQFDNLSSTSAPSQAINLVSVTGTVTVNSGSISNPTGTAVNVSGGNASMTYPGNVTQSNNAATVSVSNGHTGTLTFQTGTVSATNGTGLQFDNADGTYNFNSTTTLNGGDAGIDILNGSTGTFTFSTATSITRGNGVSGEAFNLLSSNANVTYNGSISLGTSTGNMVAINNHDAGTVTFNTGNLSKGSSTTQGISISNSNGGSVNFNNPSIAITMTSGNAVSLTNNTGSAINFATGSGTGMVLSTTSGIGFNATGGGSVSVTGSNNTISSTTGIALNVVNTAIGASGLTFRSISSNGASSGIVLNTTGSGGLTVTGGGSAGSGGTIRNGVTGISLTSAQNVSLSWMQLNDFSDFAIRGSSVVNFTMASTVINGASGDNAGFFEGSVRFTELTGSASVTNSSISGGLVDNFNVVNTSGTLNRITFDTVTIGANSVSSGSDGILIEGQNAAIVNTTVQNSFFTSTRGDHFQLNLIGTASSNLIFTGNNISNSHPAVVSGGGGIRLTGGSTGGNVTATYNISSNTIRDSNGTAIGVTKGAGTGSFSGTINGNTIGVAATNGSGSAAGSGISVISAEGGSSVTAITNNTVRQYANFGIIVQAGGLPTVGTGTLDAVVTGNTISNPSTAIFAKNGFQLNSGTVPGDAFNVCLSFGGAGALANSLAGSGTDGGTDFRLRQRQSTTVHLPGYGGANNNDAAVITFGQGNNGVTPTGSATNTVPTGGGWTGGAACATAYAMQPNDSLAAEEDAPIVVASTELTKQTFADTLRNAAFHNTASGKVLLSVQPALSSYETRRVSHLKFPHPQAARLSSTNLGGAL